LLPAFFTEPEFFLIDIFNIGARAHYAIRVLAMDKPEGMTQLMDYYFSEALNK